MKIRKVLTGKASKDFFRIEPQVGGSQLHFYLISCLKEVWIPGIIWWNKHSPSLPVSVTRWTSESERVCWSAWERQQCDRTTLQPTPSPSWNSCSSSSVDLCTEQPGRRIILEEFGVAMLVSNQEAPQCASKRNRRCGEAKGINLWCNPFEWYLHCHSQATTHLAVRITEAKYFSSTDTELHRRCGAWCCRIQNHKPSCCL